MRTLLLSLFLVGCNTPGTFGSAIFQSDEDDTPSDEEMIARLEAESVAAPTPPERVLAKVPAMPTDAWLQVFDRSARIAHRLLDDGRYTVQVGAGAAQEMPIISRAQPQARTLSDDARSRIEEAVRSVDFHAVSPNIPEAELQTDHALSLTQLRPLALTIRDEASGRVHTVEVQADVQIAESFGPIAPLWHTLDAEVFGRWLETAVSASAASSSN